VDAGSPADKAALQEGDVLLSINGARVDDARASMRSIAQVPPGRLVELSMWRDGKAQTVTATTAQWPASASAAAANTSAIEALRQEAPDPGVKLASLTDELRKQYGIDPKMSGVGVTSVDRDCEAGDLGVVAGDVVRAVQGIKVTTPEQVRQEVLKANDEGRPYAAVLINGRLGTRWVPISLGGSDAMRRRLSAEDLR
jgi:serine protease Do